MDVKSESEYGLCASAYYKIYYYTSWAEFEELKWNDAHFLGVVRKDRIIIASKVCIERSINHKLAFMNVKIWTLSI